MTIKENAIYLTDPNIAVEKIVENEKMRRLQVFRSYPLYLLARHVRQFLRM